MIGYFDIESYSAPTENERKILVPYLLASVVETNPAHRIHDEHTSFTGDKLVNNFIKYLFDDVLIKRNIRKITIFAHNFSGHDGILIIDTFAQFHIKSRYHVSVIIHNNKIYSLSIEYTAYGDKKYTVCFQCSLLLLQRSLDRLSKLYGSNLAKLPFPHAAVQSLEDLSQGKDFLKHHITDERMLAIVDEVWSDRKCTNLIDYAKEYCAIDVKILQYVINRFKEDYKSKVLTGHTRELRTSDYITISRLSIITFYQHPEYDKGEITAISGRRTTHTFIKKSYYGGKTEIYKGFLRPGTKCYYYDFPGIYSLAIQMPLPIGRWVRIKSPLFGDDAHKFINDLHENNICAFLNISFSTGTTQYPVLPTKARIGERKSIKLLFCQGDYDGVYYSHEIKFAIECGYVINKISEGYVFKSGTPLSAYAKDMTKNKNNAKANGEKPLVLLYKLLNNSLYGKFAMNPPSKSFFATQWSEVKNSQKIVRFEQVVEDLNDEVNNA